MGYGLLHYHSRYVGIQFESFRIQEGVDVLRTLVRDGGTESEARMSACCGQDKMWSTEGNSPRRQE